MVQRSHRIKGKELLFSSENGSFFVAFYTGGTDFNCAGQKNKCIQCFFIDTLDFWKKIAIIVKHIEHLGAFPKQGTSPIFIFYFRLLHTAVAV